MYVVLAEVASELHRLVRVSPLALGGLFGLQAPTAAALPREALCRQFEAAVRDWWTSLTADALTVTRLAHDVARYVGDHHNEPITLARLSTIFDCQARDLSRDFKSVMGVGIGQYTRCVRIDYAAARLREGDKVESVLAAVGWRGRKNFFKHFRDHIGLTPAEYRSAWVRARRRAPVASVASIDPINVDPQSIQPARKGNHVDGDREEEDCA